MSLREERDAAMRRADLMKETNTVLVQQIMRLNQCETCCEMDEQDGVRVGGKFYCWPCASGPERAEAVVQLLANIEPALRAPLPGRPGGDKEQQMQHVLDEIEKMRSAAGGLREEARILTARADTLDLSATRVERALDREKMAPPPARDGLAAALDRAHEAFADVRDCTACGGTGSHSGTCSRCHGSGCEPGPAAGGEG